MTTPPGIDRVRIALRRSGELAEEGRIDLASAMIDLALAESPGHPAVHLLLWRASDLAARREDASDAVDLARRAQAAAPGNPAISVHLAWTLLRTAADPDAAIDAWRSLRTTVLAAVASPEHAGLRHRADILEAVSGYSASAEAVLDQASWAAWRQGPANALALIDRGLAELPRDWRLYLRRSELLERLGRSEEAIEAARQAAQLRPGDPHTAVHLLWLVQSAHGSRAAHDVWVGLGRPDLRERSGLEPGAASRAAVLERELALVPGPTIARLMTAGSAMDGVGAFDGLHSLVVTEVQPLGEDDARRLATSAGLRGDSILIGLSADAARVIVAEGIDKAAARRQPFVHTYLREQATSVLDIPIEMIDIQAMPQVQRFIFSPGRVGSTLLAQMLRAAGVEALSELEVHRQIATACFDGRLAPETARMLSGLATASILDAPEPRVVNKLHAQACVLPSALMGPQDDAVFLWRGIEDLLRSRWRIHAMTPPQIVDRIAMAVRAHHAIRESGREIATLWYEDLARGDTAAAEQAFADLLGGRRLTVPREDSQAGTGLSREALARRSSEPAPMGELLELWARSPAIPLARELGLDPLVGSIALSRAARPAGAPAAVLPMPHRGSVEHYFHFLLGYLLPLAARFGASMPRLLVRECGPMTRHLRALAAAGWNLEIAPKAEALALSTGPETLTLVGFDHPERYASTPLRASADALRRILGAEPAANPRILVIDREAPDPFFIEGDAEVPSGGRQRRWVPNMPEVAAALEPLGGVLLTSLEQASLRDQIELFSGADLIVAQHGAALANLVWCRPGTSIIEIEHPRPRPPYFAELARTLDLHHTRIDQETEHSAIDPAAVAAIARLATK